MNPASTGESADDLVARLLMAARSDETLKTQILYLARLPGHQRESVVNTAIHEMELRGESRADRAAFALLATEEGSAAALRLLK